MIELRMLYENGIILAWTIGRSFPCDSSETSQGYVILLSLLSLRKSNDELINPEFIISPIQTLVGLCHYVVRGV